MKTLFVLRHAQAEAGGPHRDFERDLVERGEHDARRLGKLVARTGEVPDRAIASAATRARRTLELAAAAGRWPTELRRDEAIYGADLARLVELLRAEDDDAASLCVVGHEPTLSELGSMLVGGGRIHLPTAGCLRVDLDLSRWRDLGPACGELRWMMIPQLLLDGE